MATEIKPGQVWRRNEYTRGQYKNRSGQLCVVMTGQRGKNITVAWMNDGKLYSCWHVGFVHYFRLVDPPEGWNYEEWYRTVRLAELRKKWLTDGLKLLLKSGQPPRPDDILV